MTNAITVTPTALKSQIFFFWLKNKKPTNETTYFVKDFSLFAKFPFN